MKAFMNNTNCSINEQAILDSGLKISNIFDVKHRVLGRYNNVKNPCGNKKYYSTYWTGSGVEFLYSGNSLKLVIESSYTQYEPWVSVDIDGCQISKQALNNGINLIQLSNDLEDNRYHKIRLLKETQFMHEDPTQTFVIEKVIYDGTFRNPEKPSLTLEFIGDSITSAEGACANASIQKYCSAIFSAWNGYPRIVSDALNADFSVISQAGWGIVCNCENNPNCTLTNIYSKICKPAQGRNIEFGCNDSYKPVINTDFIVINLGTNDATACLANEWEDPKTHKKFKLSLDKNALNSSENGFLDNESAKIVKNGVNNLLETVRKINPDSTIIWCYGMLGNRLENLIKQSINDFCNKTSDKKIFYIELQNTSDNNLGACSHPGKIAHKNAAQILINKIRQLM
ncbi:GDSL family lipase [Bifidobacteriaceae bacterium N170]|nr:GDSL family lipase [Bifidobacteriaceae bacterium N170]